MQRPIEQATLVRLLGVGATLATALAVICWVTTQLACIIPPTMPALRHTGRLAPQSATGTFRLGGTTDFESLAGPDGGWRYRFAERLELDLAGYAMFELGTDYPNVGAMGRVGLGVGLLEREHGALALLFGFGAGGLHSEHDDEGPDGMPEHHVGDQPVLGGDLGIAGSIRYFGWFEPYLGFRFSAVATFNDGSSGTYLWLMPALGIRFLADEWVAVSLEWTNGIYFNADPDSDDGAASITGASLAIELGPTGLR